MVRSKDHFVEFEPHSEYKHLILEKYFEAWGRKLLLRRGAGVSLRFVDACAGRGRDDAGKPGSPIVAAQAATEAQRQLTEMRGEPVCIRVVAIEKALNHYRELVKNLQPFSDVAEAVQGTLADYLDALDDQSLSAPTLYFIDPFGLDALQAGVVRRALSGPNNEALILFADQAALRHYGAAVAEESAAERRFRLLGDQPLLFPEIAEQDRRTLAPKVQRSRESRQVTGQRATQILTAAFGGSSWQSAIEGCLPAQRRQVFLDLYEDLLRSFGARYVLRVPVLNEEGGHVYHLIHASKSPKGYVAMKEAVEYSLKHGPLPIEVVATMRASLGADIGRTAQEIATHFAGQMVRWADDPKDRDAESVRTYALERTELFPFEAKILQEKLRGYRLPGRAIVYDFPSAKG